MGIDGPGEADQPLERPERRDQPERIEPEVAPADRAEMDRLGDVGKRWDAIGRYEGDRANLPNPDRAEAVQYIKEHRFERPWLLPSTNAPADTQRVIASMDQGQGHQLERHEGFTDDNKLERRVTAFEDPAQLNCDKRAAGLDGITGKEHFCADMATSIQDPERFATAFARGIEHPQVREILDRTELGNRPNRILIPIEELLGPDGHQHCSGFRLLPIDGDMKAAENYRKAWVKADPDDRGEPPQVEPIDSFEGGHILFAFRPNPDRTGWEVLTMYPEPPKQDGADPR